MTISMVPKDREPGKNKFPWLRLGLTIGDPAGIGPEILIKALAKRELLPLGAYLIFSPPSLLEAEAKALKVKLKLYSFADWEKAKGPGFFLFPLETSGEWAEKGRASAVAGQISFQAFSEAFLMAQQGLLEGIVTAPVSKLSWALAGIPWHGHTEYLENFYPEAIMAFWSRRLRVALFTHHLPLVEAQKKITRENLINFFRRLESSLNRFYGRRLECLVAGLNPHAGEDGLLGEEENKEIVPAITEVRQMGLSFSGPYPPDVIFRQALDRRDCLVVALYHDQGLIAFKLVSFADGVNLTLGLPFVRTSPDHGTAFDIAGKGMASEKSMVAAIRLAHRMAARLTS